MSTRKIILALLLSLGFIASSFAQIKIKGSVSDSSGEPLIGASVASADKSKVTITDMNGAFELSLPEETKLVVSYVGYLPREVKVKKDKSFYAIVLEEDVNVLDEMVVVGYGKQRKETITGAIDNVDGKQLNLSFNSNAQNTLTGKLAGVTVVQKSGEPGKFNSSINVRGFGTPLVVIDGVTSTMDVFNRLSPTEIENISVLKDASASVYGMKAGNGVLLVTTRQGSSSKGQKPTIEYQANVGFSKVVNFNEPMDAYNFAIMENEIRKYKLNPEAPLYSDEQLEAIKNTKGLDVYDAVMRKVNPMQSHTVNISGNSGGKYDIRYFLSGNFLKEYGLFKSGDLSYDKYSLRSNVSAGLGYGLKATVNLSYVKDTKEEPYKQAWKEIWGLRPVDVNGNVLTSLYANDDPNYFLKLSKFGTNPLASSIKEVSGYSNFYTQTLRGQLGLDWAIPFVKGLEAKFMYTFEEYAYKTKRWNKQYSLYDQGTLQETVYNSPSTLKRDFEGYLKQNMQASLNYSTSIQNNNIKLLLLFEQTTYSNPGNFSGMREFPMDALDEMPAGSTENQQIGTSYPKYDANQGFVGRLNYDYSGKYLAEVGFRYDGSSCFAKGHQWGFFPNMSLGWRFSEENFIKENESLDFVDNLKLRLSYGVLGDDSGVYYNWASGFNYPSGSYIFDGEVVSGLVSNGVTNPNLTWYTSKMGNVGFDFSLWNSKLAGTVDVYARYRDGLLATRAGSAPTTTGAKFPQENLNSDFTYGWDFMLSHSNRVGEFNYTVSMNLGFSRIKNLHVESARATNSYDNWRNNKNDRWSDVTWGHIIDGQITSQSQVENILNHMKTSQMAIAGPGDYYHLDLNGDGWVTEWEDLTPSFTDSRPKLVGGLSFACDYKGIDLNMVFNTAALYTVVYEEFLRNPSVFGGEVGALSLWQDRWHQDEAGNWIPGKYPRYREEWAYLPNVWDDSRRIKNAWYIRLKNIELGYTFPARWLESVKIQKFRVYASAYNLLTLTNITEMDPEYPGNYMYPMTQNFSFGVNLIF